MSKGCENCYAERVAARFSGPGQAYEGLARVTSTGKPRWTGVVREIPAHLADPLRWERPELIFVDSMSDLFHPSVRDEWIAAVIGVIALAQRHRFQLLTKRPQRMREFFRGYGLGMCLTAAAANLQEHAPDAWKRLERAIDGPFGPDAPLLQWPLANLMLGVSAEDQSTWDERVPLLLDTPARWRFVSVEPMLGPVDIGPVLRCCRCGGRGGNGGGPCGLCDDTGVTPGLDQIIGGGESGEGARPCHIEWARELRDASRNAALAFFWKQWGEWIPTGPHSVERVGKKAAGHMLDGVEWFQHPAGFLPEGWAK